MKGQKPKRIWIYGSEYDVPVSGTWFANYDDAPGLSEYVQKPQAELVDEVRRKVTQLPYTRGEHIHWERETKALLRQFLEWVEGNG